MTKKIISIMFLIILSSLASAQEYFLYEDFEDNSLLNPNWGATPSITITSNGFMHGSYEGYTDASAYNYITMNSSGTGYYNMSFMARLPDVSGDRVWYHAYTGGGSSPGIANGAMCALGTSNYLYCYNGSSLKTIQAVSSDTNYVLSYLLNGSSGDWGLYVDGVYEGLFLARGTMTGGYLGFDIIPDNVNMDGYVDRIIVTNASVVATEIIVELITPIDNDHTNDNPIGFLFNATATENTNCSLIIDNTIDQTLINLNLTTETQIQFNKSLMTDGVYNWTVNCSNSLATGTDTNRIIVYDTISPDITWNKPLNDNTTIIQYDDSFIPINITLNDTYLFAYNNTIKFLNGTIYYQEFNNTITLEQLEYYRELDNTTYPFNAGDEFIMSLTVADDHTAKFISAVPVTKKTNELEYSFPSAKVTVYTDDKDIIASDTVKEVDRYTFNFEYSKSKKKRVYYVKSDKPIYYRGELYPFPSFVTGSQWVDFNTEDLESYTVTKINDYIYKVELVLTKTKDKETYRSIGGLNIITETVYFKISEPSAPPVLTGVSPNGDFSMDENSSVSFVVNASDPENDTLNYKYYLDGVLVSSVANWTYTTDFNDAGLQNMTLRLSDGSNTIYYTWNITVNNVNLVAYADDLDYQPYTPWYSNIENAYIICQGNDIDNETAPINWSVEIDYRTNLLWTSLNTSFYMHDSWRANVDLTLLEGKTLDARCRISDGSGYTDYIYLYDFVTVQEEYIPITNVSSINPSGVSRDYVTSVTCSPENYGSTPSYKLLYDIDAYYNGSWHNLSYNLFNKALFDMSEIAYNETVNFRCRINDGITTTSYKIGENVTRKHITNLMMYSGLQDEVVQANIPYSKGLLADFVNENNIEIYASYADCNGDGYYDYYYQYNDSRKWTKESFICINRQGIVTHSVGVLLNKTGINNAFCSDKTNGLCNIKRTYEVLVK